MTPFKRNLSKLLFIALVLALGTIISGVIYYFKMDSNEDTLNTLLFRELKQIEGTLHRSFDKVKITSQYILSDTSAVSTCGVNDESIKTAIDKLGVSDDLADIRLVDSGVVSARNPEPYALSIPSFDQASFVINKPCDNTAEPDTFYQLHLTSSVSDSLRQRIARFQTVALVEAEGKVLSVVNHASQLSDETDLLIKRITHLHPAPIHTEDETTAFTPVIEGTNFIDTQVSDNDFRVYVHPIMASSLTSAGQELYLIGVIEKSAINQQKLKLSPTLLMWLILGLLFLIAITPLIKLRYISTTHAIARGDKSQIMLGIVVAIGIVTIGWIQELFFNYFETVKAQQLSILHREISNDFVQEVSTVLSIVQQATDDSCRRHRSPDQQNAVYDNQICQQSLTADSNASAGGLARKRIVETVAVINAKGQVSSDFPVLYSSEHLVFEQAIDLAKRNYVKAGLAGQFWQLTEPAGEATSNFFIQRVFNIEDGRKNAMLSIPFAAGKFSAEPAPFSVEAYSQFRLSQTFSSYQKMGFQKAEDDTDQSEPQLIIAGTRFGSLVDRVMPNNFGFAVIDEAGNVLFHSDDSLSLIENFFTETNRNPELLVASRHNQLASPTLMKLDYKGSPHTVLIGPMQAEDAAAPEHNTIPWRLVVFFNPESLQTNNMILVFMAVFLFMLVIIPAFAVMRYLMLQRFWQDICYFDTQHLKRYKSYALILFATALCLQYQTGVVLPFTSRLVMWAAACALIGLFLIRQFTFDASYSSFWRRPQTWLLAIPLLLFSVDMLDYSGAQRELIQANQLFSVLGIFLVAMAVESFRVWGKPDTFISCRRRDNRAIEKRRYTAGYIWYLTGLLYLAAAVPASLIAFTAHDYLLQRQASFEASHIKQSMLQHQFGYQDYLSFLNATPCNPGSASAFPCVLISDYKLPELISSFYPPAIQAATVSDCGINCKSWVLINPQPTEETIRPDSFFNAIFSITPSQTEFISHLTFAAKQDLTYEGRRGAAHDDELVYRADLLMLAAAQEGSGPVIALIMFLGLPLGIYLSVRQLLVQRLMGEHLQDQFRVLPHCTEYQDNKAKFPDIGECLKYNSEGSLLVLNATRLQAEEALKCQTITVYENRVFRLPECLSGSDNGGYFLAEVQQAIHGHSESPVIVAISAVEQVSTCSSLRRHALSFLYQLHNLPGISLLVIAETAPLYRLLNPCAYEVEASDDNALSSDEKAGWSKLFSEFTKHYAWSPVQKRRLSNPYDVEQLIYYECQAWPEIAHLSAILREQTNGLRKFSGADTAEGTDSVADFWEPEQVIEFMLTNAGALYRRKWEECTRQEKLIQWKLANGASINPANAVVIERLVRRGYLYRDKGWSIITESFRQFVLTAENEQVINVWLDNADTGAWSVLRIPVFAMLLVLVVIFVYSSGSSLNTLLSVATAALGLIPLLLKNLSLLKGGAGSDIE
ncbi:hypothetical protein [Alteromonas lipolytica]|uniref:Cache domain-containing protein n=1 Tax=Alteromonas lipolytica TaxID=1856405 RepID=A0A1E8F9D5_9ALTE|nr:hypothetical protein [Alteromonas lipolytica]OFI32153.1 hypothetical protein BFC17_07965 [Alteromonas lipolytica]GGF83453.1 hypothetical protein GCM10011338_39740 [Alteromonas lipolytica]